MDHSTRSYSPPPGLNRLGLTRDIQELLSVDDFVPAPGQAALAVQCREDDADDSNITWSHR